MCCHGVGVRLGQTVENAVASEAVGNRPGENGILCEYAHKGQPLGHGLFSRQRTQLSNSVGDVWDAIISFCLSMSAHGLRSSTTCPGNQNEPGFAL